MSLRVAFSKITPWGSKKQNCCGGGGGRPQSYWILLANEIVIPIEDRNFCTGFEENRLKTVICRLRL